MSLERVLQSMRLRMPWRVGQKVLEAKGIRRGRGWSDTEFKLEDLVISDEKLAGLVNNVEQHLMCGEKLTRFYNLDRASINRLTRDFENITVPESDMRTIFPMVLQDEDLADH